MVMRAALELFHNRNFPSVVAVCKDALVEDPGNLHMRLLLARALLALRRDVEAQQVLSEALQREPRCADAYRLLASLALRADELKSAEIFAREALRIDPDCHDTRELLELVLRLCRPTAAVEKLPAATVAVGRPFPRGGPYSPPGAAPSSVRRSAAPARPRLPPRPPQRRLAVGTEGGRQRFGEYLVEIGCLTPAQLRAVIAYHRSVGVRLGAAAAALGFISEPKVEWAAQAFHARR